MSSNSQETIRASVIVRCFNEAAHIGNLLDGLVRQTVRPQEIIVVDSGSTDETVTIASGYDTRITHIAPEDFTFGRSLNRGCALAQGDVLVLASAHVIPCADDWLERLTTPFGDPAVALTYGRQVGHATSKYSECRLFEKQYPSVSIADQQIPFCNNANAAIRRRLWEAHAYDETLTGLEDLAWAKWALAAGHRISYVAEAGIIHIHDESPKKVFRRYEREAIALRQIFPDSHMKIHEFTYLLVAHVLGDWWGALRTDHSLRRFGEILKFRTMQYWGTFRGMNERSPVTHQLIRKFYYPESIPKAPSVASQTPDVPATRHV